MDPSYYGLIELVFSGAVVLGFGIWHLVSINREIAADKARDRARDRDGDAASPERPGHPVREHRLDDR